MSIWALLHALVGLNHSLEFRELFLAGQWRSGQQLKSARYYEVAR